MIKYNQFFNKNTLNIFTDASILNRSNKNSNYFIGAPGYIATINDIVLSERIEILTGSTNNESELYAIYMAIQFALLNRDKVKIINIFSDSKFCIYGLREWIFKWINNIKDDKIYNSSGKEVSNQKLFLNIVYTILSYNLEVNFYHVRGHFKEDDAKLFSYEFKLNNFMNDDIDIYLAKRMIYYNNRIDNDTRQSLSSISNNSQKLWIPEYFAREDIDIDHYKELIKFKF